MDLRGYIHNRNAKLNVDMVLPAHSYGPNHSPVPSAGARPRLSVVGGPSSESQVSRSPDLV